MQDNNTWRREVLIDGATPMRNSEAEVKIEISRYVDDSFPGWVECILVDALGVEHMFVEKVPVVTEAHLDENISYPQPGVIACVVLERSERDDGRQLVHIDTQKPWGVESTAGRSRFEVFPEQLREINSD
jgi:hypothetical protein